LTFKEVVDRVMDLQAIRHAIEIPSDWGPPGPAIMLSCVWVIAEEKPTYTMFGSLDEVIRSRLP
jgi:hypothetical protein